MQLGANYLLLDVSTGSGQRQVGRGESTTLRVGQHLFLTLSGHKTKRYTLNNTVAPVMSRQQPAAVAAAPPRADGAHKRVYAMNENGSAEKTASGERITAGGEDPYGWSLNNYPADKRARIRLAEVGGGSGGSGKATADEKPENLFTPPARVDMRQYKQTTLSFSLLSADDSSSSSSPSASLGLDPSSAGFYHIAFPCLALNTANSQSTALIRTGVDAIASFLLTHTAPMLRLLLCEGDDGAYFAIKRHLDTVEEDSAVQLRGDSRFKAVHASVAALDQSRDVSQSIVNSTDWKWSSAGDKKRRAIDAACNHQLTQLTLASLPPGKTAGREGQVQCVPLTQPCPLTEVGVRQVIQVITPELTMAASRAEETLAGHATEQSEPPDDVEDKPSDEDINKLLDAYQKLFHAWYSQLKLPKHYVRPAPQQSPRKASSPWPAASTLRPSQSDALLPDNFATASTPLPPYSAGRTTAPPVVNGGWHTALRGYLQHPRPTSVQSSVYCEDRSYLVIYDAYPKSRCHLLMLAKSHLPQLSSIAAVTSDTLYLLHDMQQRADSIVAAVMQQMQANSSRRLECWIGFHALPSLQPLHCHLLTSDLSTVHMKHKKVQQQLPHHGTHTARLIHHTCSLHLTHTLLCAVGVAISLLPALQLVRHTVLCEDRGCDTASGEGGRLRGGGGEDEIVREGAIEVLALSCRHSNHACTQTTSADMQRLTRTDCDMPR